MKRRDTTDTWEDEAVPDTDFFLQIELLAILYEIAYTV